MRTCRCRNHACHVRIGRVGARWRREGIGGLGHAYHTFFVPLVTDPEVGDFTLSDDVTVFEGRQLLRFRTGDTHQTFTVTAAPDDDLEDETVQLRFGNLPARVSAGTPATATVALVDGDRTPLTASFDRESYRTTGNGEPATVTVRLDSPSDRTFVLPLVTDPESGDFTLSDDELVFDEGDTSRTFTVTATPDDDLEHGTVQLRFGSLPADVSPGTPETATVTLVDVDRTTWYGAVTQSWAVRFGRTVAEQVVAAMEGRIAAAPRPGVELRLAGRRVGVEGPAPEGAEARALDIEREAAISRWLRGSSGSWAGSGIGGGPSRRSGWHEVSERDLLPGASFSLTAENEAGGGGLVSLWGRGALTRFEGREGGPSLDGEVASLLVDTNWTQAPRPGSGAGTWTAGLTAVHSRGTGGFEGKTGGGVEAALTGFYPYARHALNDRVTLWGVGGYGKGNLRLKPEDDAEIETDLTLTMAAAGLRGVVVEAPKEGGPELAVRTDALHARTTTAEVSSKDLAATEGAATRLRLGLEATWHGLGTGGREMTPRLEIGLRLDGGDADTGFGADIGGGLAWSSQKGGLRAEVGGRGLLTHQAPGFRELGFAGSLTWDRRPDSDRGPRLTLRHTAGVQASGGTDALFDRDTLAALAADDISALPHHRFEVRMGYGLPAFGDRFTAMPELGFALSDSAREYRLGWPFTLDRSGGSNAFELRPEAIRIESTNDEAGAEHRIGVRLTARW